MMLERGGARFQDLYHRRQYRPLKSNAIVYGSQYTIADSAIPGLNEMSLVQS